VRKQKGMAMDGKEREGGKERGGREEWKWNQTSSEIN